MEASRPDFGPGQWADALVALWRRPSRPVRILVAVVLAGVVGAAILFAAFAVAARGDVRRTLTEGPALPPAGGVVVSGSVVRVDPVANELAVRLAFVPTGELVVDGVLDADLVLRLNDSTGATVVDFAEGEVMAPLDATFALSGAQIGGYPFDEYDVDIVLVLTTATDGGAGPEPVPISLTLRGEPQGYRITASRTVADTLERLAGTTAPLPDVTTTSAPVSGGPAAPAAIETVALRVTRAAPVVAYAVGMMVFFWALAIVAISTLWIVVGRGAEIPLWWVGFFVGSLFALPPLRNTLPGSPPQGAVFDFASFYWALAVLSFTTVAFVVVYLRREARALRAVEREVAASASAASSTTAGTDAEPAPRTDVTPR